MPVPSQGHDDFHSLIMSGKNDPEISNIFQHQEQENRNTRGHKYKLFKPRCRLNIRKNSFCIRVVNMWNSLKMLTNPLLVEGNHLPLGPALFLQNLILNCLNYGQMIPSWTNSPPIRVSTFSSKIKNNY
jgi:hypothetical protein